ncbi:MAG: transcription antitermination protein NusB [Rikenellaceae bacterium]
MISRRLIRIKIIQTLYAHFLNEDNIITTSQSNLSHSLDKCYGLYYLMLQLPCDVAAYSRNKIDIAREKHLHTDEDINPNMRFVDNPIISYLENSSEISEYLGKNGLSWQGNGELIKTLFNSMSTKDYYITYMNKPTCSFSDHRKFILNFYKNEIEECNMLYDIVEEMSIYWVTELEYTASHAMATISQISASQVSKVEELELLPKFKEADDEEFARVLFIKAASERVKNLEYIESFIHNWDVERIAFMDKVIMLAALSEIRNFDSIPLSVTLNEYIEISKYYSTLKSKTFINGILDKIVADMKAKNEISPSKL